MRNVKRQTCKNDRCATVTDGQVRGERQRLLLEPEPGAGTQLQQHVSHSCQLNVYDNVRPGDPSSGDSSTWAPSQLSFPTDMGWGTPSPPTRWSSTGRGIRGHGEGVASGSCCGPSFLSSRHLHGELPSALEPQLLTQTGQVRLRGARGSAAQGKPGQASSRLSGAASAPLGLTLSSSQER